ncbi:helix-turn-helix transcriptional regulator [Actinomycetaceae bacterium WB03_NA08]|uniref:Helix-turn-helix transcriptional regulator n=1 Tax=Scrofimicrobium canadense TaxID=2652290 RepID=A0A6N7VU51_9ACTO|nr:helix-turn-helix transcriptional regulator [Scrofimicrobium canadense]MSS84500.1 helix-turn-helix transcriptional regulator [Scrofimicrobium canadense]
MANPPVNLGEHGQAFATNMRVVRKNLGIEMQDLAEQIRARGHAITRDQLIRIEAGQRRATVDDACEIARALKTKLIRLVVPSHLQLVPNRPLHGSFADHRPTRDIMGGKTDVA